MVSGIVLATLFGVGLYLAIGIALFVVICSIDPPPQEAESKCLALVMLGWPAALIWLLIYVGMEALARRSAKLGARLRAWRGLK